MTAVHYPPRDEFRYGTLPQKTFIAIVLDRSGSMSSVKDATIEAFNGFVTSQRQQTGESYFTLAQFDTDGGVEFLYEGRPSNRVEMLNGVNYQPRGGTPLFDAIGIVAGRAREYASKNNFDGKVLVIQTDGQENASKEWQLPAIRTLLQDLERDGWQLIYLGAGIDAYASMKSTYGTYSAQSISYGKDRGSTITMGNQMSAAVMDYMATGTQQSADLNIAGTDVTVRSDTDTKGTSKPEAGKSSSKPKTKK